MAKLLFELLSCFSKPKAGEETDTAAVRPRAPVANIIRPYTPENRPTMSVGILDSPVASDMSAPLHVTNATVSPDNASDKADSVFNGPTPQPNAATTAAATAQPASSANNTTTTTTTIGAASVDGITVEQPTEQAAAPSPAPEARQDVISEARGSTPYVNVKNAVEDRQKMFARLRNPQ